MRKEVSTLSFTFFRNEWAQTFPGTYREDAYEMIDLYRKSRMPSPRKAWGLSRILFVLVWG